MAQIGKSGPKRGELGKNRRLARELANKQGQLEIINAVSSTLKELVRTANSNPVVGLGLGIVAVDLLYRTRAISIVAAGSFYALLSATVAGGILSDLALFIPSMGTKESKDAIQPTASTLAYGEDRKVVFNRPTQQGVG